MSLLILFLSVAWADPPPPVPPKPGSTVVSTSTCPDAEGLRLGIRAAASAPHLTAVNTGPRPLLIDWSRSGWLDAEGHPGALTPTRYATDPEAPTFSIMGPGFSFEDTLVVKPAEGAGPAAELVIATRAEGQEDWCLHRFGVAASSGPTPASWTARSDCVCKCGLVASGAVAGLDALPDPGHPNAPRDGRTGTGLTPTDRNATSAARHLDLTRCPCHPGRFVPSAP